MAYYRRIRDLREDNDLEQKNMADIIDKSVKQYGRYERGETDIPLKEAIKLALYYKVSLDYIAGLTDNKTNGTTINNGTIANSGKIKTINMGEEKGIKGELLNIIDILPKSEQAKILSYTYELIEKRN